MNSNLVKETISVSSSRPELRCPPSAVIENFEDREWKINLGKHLSMLSAVILVEGKCSEALSDAGFSSPETPFMFQLEKSLLDVSSPSLTNGSFYCTLFRINDVYYCRFFESGILNGYFLSEGIRHVENYIQEQQNDFAARKLIWSQVFTQDDINQYHQRYTARLERKRSHQSMSNPGADVGRRYNTLMEKNKTGVLNSFRKLMAKAQVNDSSSEVCRLLGTVVNVIKHNSHKEKNPHKARFLDSLGVFHPLLHVWENSIQHFRTDGVPAHIPQFKSLFDPPHSSLYTWHEQCKMISSIPNDHYWNEGTHAHVGYNRMLSVRDSSGKYKPASLRNLILMHHRESNHHCIFQLVNKFRNPEVTSSNLTINIEPNINQSEDNLEENRTHRSYRARRKALTEEDILRNILFINPHFSAENRASENSLYDQYRTTQIETGKLFWRIHQPNLDIICLNDVSMSNGSFLESSFVHMSRTTIGNNLQYNCTCNLFTTLLQLATLNDQEDEIDSINIRCCHIRFFQEIIEPDLPIYFSQDLFHVPTKTQNAVILSTTYLGKPVCALTSSLRTEKFSVISKDGKDCKFVNLSKNRLACQSGECSSIYSFSTRKILYLDKTANLCPHLEAMKDNKDVWFNERSGVNVEEDEEDDENDMPLINEDDDIEVDELFQAKPDIKRGQTNNFNQATGLWDFPSLSEHQPKNEDDPLLQLAIKKRLSIFDGTEGVGRDSSGYLTSDNCLLLCPPVLQDGCLCGAGYFNDAHPEGILTEVKYRPTVYLTNGPARYEVRDRMCLASNPECNIQYNGSSDSLHFLSKETAAGDEIGWDYVDHALNTHITFSAYCKIMTKKYKRNNIVSAKFMSPQTFISWWFSWSSKFKIDFRKPCSICKYNPKFLACDGTKIGISFKNADINPIETATAAELIDPSHRRNDRSFINYDVNHPEQCENKRKCREHLAYMSKKALGLLNTKEILAFAEEVDKSTNLIECMPDQCSDLMRRFVCNEYPEGVQKKLAVIFQFLATCHSLSSLIPFRYVDLLESVLLELRTTTQNNRINLISEFSPEICSVLYAALSSEQSLSDVISLFQYLISRIREIKDKNKEPSPAVCQPGSYNPERNGVAYYFTPSGEKLRDIPVYTMNENAHSKNYDDLPPRADEQCNKIYPEVSRRGTTYLFLWFCPKHYGHCYGFHIITGSEGRKDPFCSAYTYLEQAPEELFYDFSCQLEEYCLNREPGFWENTRFWHDLFHGYSHKCPFCYKSQRLCPLQGINTEICEQFNSFIQKIKYSARSMSLGKFCYYIQFMIYQWCEMKRSSFEKRCDIAAAYLA